MQKNILLITSRSDHGGGPKHVLELASFLKKENFGLYIASPTSPPYFESYKTLADSHFEIPHRKFCFKAFLGLALFCLKNRINIIHSHGFGAGLYSRPLKILGIEIIHTFHGVHRADSFLGHIKNFIQIPLSLLTDRFIHVSQDEKLNSLDLGITDSFKLKVIPNGIDTQIAPPTRSYKNDLPNEVIVLGAITRLAPHKNNLELVKAVSKLDSHYHLLIAGDGEEKNSLESLVKELSLDKRVHFLGFIEDTSNILHDIDIFVSFSKGEGMPYSVLEAMLYSKPILVSDVSGHQELLDKDQLFSNTDEFLSMVQNIKLTQYQYNMDRFSLETNLKLIVDNY